MVNGTFYSSLGKKAIAELKAIYSLIFLDSPSAALKIRDELIRTAGSLQTMPRKFEVFQFKNTMLGEYRSIIRWRYRIIYQIIKNTAHIVRIVHTNKQHKSLIF